MRLIAIKPTKATRNHLKALGVDYEVVESAAQMSARFKGHNGFFDGIIAPNNPDQKMVQDIINDWYVRARGLPIFIFGNLIEAKEKFGQRPADKITFAYKVSLLCALKSWVKEIQAAELV